MNPPIPRCPGSILTSMLPLRGSSHECHNLTSYWNEDRGVVHEMPGEDLSHKTTHPDFMETLNHHLLQSYKKVANDTTLNIREMWMESTGFFPLASSTKKEGKTSVRVFYRAILKSTGTAAALSHLHNLVKQETTEAFSESIDLKINSQLLVRS